MSRATVLTGAAFLLLLVILAFELRSVGVQPDVDSRPASRVSSRESASAEAPPVGVWANVTLARPLFAENRRPTQITGQITHIAQGALPRLAGTIRADRIELAIFQPPDGKPVVAGRGAKVADWTVSDIGDGAVSLQRGGNTVTLHLSYANVPIKPRPAPSPVVVVLHAKRSSPFLQP